MYKFTFTLGLIEDLVQAKSVHFTIMSLVLLEQPLYQVHWLWAYLLHKHNKGVS